MLKKLLSAVFIYSIIITQFGYSMNGNQNNGSEKKSRRCLYGAVVENFEQNSKKVVREPVSLKIFQNKTIDAALKKSLEN